MRNRRQSGLCICPGVIITNSIMPGNAKKDEICPTRESMQGGVKMLK